MDLRIALLIHDLLNVFFLLLESFRRGAQKFINLLNLMIMSSDDKLTQSARDVLGTSPEGPLKVRDLQGTCRGLLGDQHKNWRFDEKSAF